MKYGELRIKQIGAGWRIQECVGTLPGGKKLWIELPSLYSTSQAAQAAVKRLEEDNNGNP